MDMDTTETRSQEAAHFEQAARRYHRTDYHVHSDQNVMMSPRRKSDGSTG